MTVHPAKLLSRKGARTASEAFGAYITSYLPDDPAMRAARRSGFERQLSWWLTNTDVSVYVLLSNWTDEEIAATPSLTLSACRGKILRRGPQPLITNRIECLQEFYSGDHDWGIMMDDDAILYDKHHNSGSRLFSEMAENGVGAYTSVDVFFPINPQKIGFNPIWKKNPTLFERNHVFRRNLDLKGSMFVVRNFIRQGRPGVFPPAEYLGYGEDTFFAIEAVAKGCTVLQCQNIVLNELKLPSNFATANEDRKPKMRRGHEAIVERYGHLGIKMKENSHLLDKRQFQKNCWPQITPTLITVPKP